MNVINWIRRREGPFTKKGAVLDYDEVHTAQLGFTAGVGRKSLEEAYSRDKEAVNFDLGDERWYYKIGYRSGQFLRDSGIGAAAVSILPLVV